ncbi:MAG: hypothetical protein ACRDPY_22730 [Streptosporangiaceae bacterium]
MICCTSPPAACGTGRPLVPFTEGSHSGLFSSATTTRPEGHLVVFSLRDVPDKLRPAATLLALDTTWRAVSDPARRRRRLITVDEAWLLMRDPEGAKFLFRLARSARKAWAGLAAVTQDAEDVLSTDLSRAVTANSATQILLRQARRRSARSRRSSGCRRRLAGGEPVQDGPGVGEHERDVAGDARVEAGRGRLLAAAGMAGQRHAGVPFSFASGPAGFAAAAWSGRWWRGAGRSRSRW